LRAACPDISITTDIITGFPGETEADFQQTLDLIKIVEFDSLFGFIYSDRPNAIATGFSDKIPEKEKRNRLNQILDLQKKYTKKKNMAMIGKTELILVEGLSKMQKKGDMQNGSTDFQWSGRTSTNKIVNFFLEDCSSYNNIKGEMIEVIIEKALSHSLWGKPKKNENLYHYVKGEKDNAA
jgi:tRNA-2-methylthio-N6-dimethylallyladenosine synthase